MYKQSAAVLALFLGTSSATQVSQGFATGMNGDEDMGEDITMKGDKFHFAQNVQLSAEPAVKADYPPPEKVHTLDPKIAKAHTTFYNKLGQQVSNRRWISDSHPVNNDNIDDWVYERAHEAADDIPQFNRPLNPPAELFSRKQYRTRGDISEAVDSQTEQTTKGPKKVNGINPDVHDFVHKNVERLAWPRSEEPFVANGSGVTFPSAFLSRSGSDISEAIDSQTEQTTKGPKGVNGINADVHDFANKNVDRLNWPRSEEAFVPNGSQVTFPASLYQHRRHNRDISEALGSQTVAGEKVDGIDAEVHGLANSMVDRINWNRSQEPFVPNGSKVTFPSSLYQHRRNNRDISEALGSQTVAGEKVDGIDAEVHGLANSMVDRINWNRSQEPFIPNGSKVTFPSSLYQHRRNNRDISEALGSQTVAGEKVDGIDAEVHGLANSMVDRINWNRSQEPFIPNGSKITFPSSLYQQHVNQHAKDIANKEVRPDVWVTVHKMVDPVAHWRGKTAPETNYEPWWGMDGKPPLTELKKPSCPPELEEQPNQMKKKLQQQAKAEKAKKAKELEEMPGDIEEPKPKKEDKKGDVKEEKPKADAPKEEEAPKEDEKPKDDAPAAATAAPAAPAKDAAAPAAPAKDAAAPAAPPKASLLYDNANQLWRFEY